MSRAILWRAWLRAFARKRTQIGETPGVNPMPRSSGGTEESESSLQLHGCGFQCLEYFPCVCCTRRMICRFANGSHETAKMILYSESMTCCSTVSTFLRCRLRDGVRTQVLQCTQHDLLIGCWHVVRNRMVGKFGRVCSCKGAVVQGSGRWPKVSQTSEGLLIAIPCDGVLQGPEDGCWQVVRKILNCGFVRV